jgi:hypothetical protein
MQAVLDRNLPDVSVTDEATLAAGMEWTEEDERAWQESYAAWQAARGYRPCERLSRQAFTQEFYPEYW